MFKRWKARKKLQNYRRDHPRQNIGPDGNVILDESHIVCFINDEYPEEHKMLALIDVASKWMFRYGSTQDAMRWDDRKSNPVILKVGSSFELERIIKSGYLNPQITTSYFAGELIAFCIGPVWNSRLDNYNLYEKITYE